jgi:hypothetical protein
MTRFLIVKDRIRKADRQPWELWLAQGVLRTLLARRSTHARCIAVMDRLVTSR